MHHTLRHCAGPFAIVFSLAAGAMPALAEQPARAACDAGFETVLAAAPGPVPETRAVWLDGRHLRWPGVAPVGRFRLVHSREGRLQATPGQAVSGADTALALALQVRPLPPASAQRFKWVGAGATLSVQGNDVARLRELHRGQLWVVHEDDQGRVLQASGLQAAGALDELLAGAGTAPDLGATMAKQRTQFKLLGAPPRRRCGCACMATARPPRCSCCRFRAAHAAASGPPPGLQISRATTTPTWWTYSCPAWGWCATASPIRTR